MTHDGPEVATVTDEAGVTTRFWSDAAGPPRPDRGRAAPAQPVRGYDAGPGGYEGTVAYTYDALDRVTSIIGSDAGTLTYAYDDLDPLPPGARDVRVNQQRVNAAGQRVGTNRPDLQYTSNGRRHYVEFEGPGAPRGAPHTQRILSNDPSGCVTVRIVP